MSDHNTLQKAIDRYRNWRNNTLQYRHEQIIKTLLLLALITTVAAYLGSHL